MDPRQFASLDESDLRLDPLLALSRRMEILVFWREMDQLVFAEVCEFFALQLVREGVFLELARLWLENSVSTELTRARASALAQVIETDQPERAAQLRMDSQALPSGSSYQRYSELMDELGKLGEWDKLTAGEKKAYLDRLRESAAK